MNLLFVCSRNQWRSPTAEAIFKDHPFYTVRSAGTSNSARIKLSEKIINWADLIFVMEKKHKQVMQELYSSSIQNKNLIVLDIEDEYQYMDPELIEIIKYSVAPYLKDL